ncbi:MAG: hypothetical protein ACE14T_12160 [Syntrophales bacterium]
MNYSYSDNVKKECKILMFLIKTGQDFYALSSGDLIQDLLCPVPVFISAWKGRRDCNHWILDGPSFPVILCSFKRKDEKHMTIATKHDALVAAVEITKAYVGSSTEQKIAPDLFLDAVYRKLKELVNDIKS